MNKPGFLKRFAGPAVAGLLMMILVITVAALILKIPFIAKYIPSVELDPADQVAQEGAPEKEPESEAAAPVAEIDPAVACTEEAERVNYRLATGRSCRSHVDCAMAAPRERCLVTLNIGLSLSIEDALFDYGVRCPAGPALSALDSLCRRPDRDWSPSCVEGVCELREGSTR
ncbi:MAG: hypothetical protein AAF385_06505 [Pseudomonadota bacterium]